MQSPNQPALIPEMCRDRQRRIVEAVAPLGVDKIILSRVESIQWLTGWRSASSYSPIAAIDADGSVTLVMPLGQIEAPAAVDRRVSYEAVKCGTMRHDQRAASSAALVAALGAQPNRIACEFSSFDQHLAKAWLSDIVDIEPILFRLRRRKDHDELAMMRKAIDANRAMYERARQSICPGVSELDLFNKLHEVAVTHVGEPLTYFGQDFQCNTRGGPPRHRRVESNELYILDLGVGYRGYFSDNARTYFVGLEPTQEQFRSWQCVMQVFPLIESRVRPGERCRAIYDEVYAMLNSESAWVFDHHLGHGIGLAPHEAPHLNPHWDDSFEEGDVFTVEPGLYHPTQGMGIRIEQIYRVSPQGVELLSDWPTDL
jgi:Xaa-Pro dipeptidase